MFCSFFTDLNVGLLCDIYEHDSPGDGESCEALSARGLMNEFALVAAAPGLSISALGSTPPLAEAPLSCFDCNKGHV